MTAARGSRASEDRHRKDAAPGRIVRRLWCAAAIAVALAAGSVTAFVVGLHEQDAAVEQVARAHGPVDDLNEAARADFARVQALFRGYLITGDPSYLARARAARRGLATDLARAVSIASAGQLPEVLAQRHAMTSWLGIAATQARPGRGHPRPVEARLTRLARPSSQAFYAANGRLEQMMQARARAELARGQQALGLTAAWAGGLGALIVLVAAVTVAMAVRGLTGPLAAVSVTARRLAADGHGARARESGYREVREVARSVNVLADESDRLRAEQAETIRLLGLAREAGNRIRAHLRVGDVVRETSAAIEAGLDADVAWVFLVEDGKVGGPVGREHDPLLPDDYVGNVPLGSPHELEQLYRRGECVVVADLRGQEAESIPPPIRDPLVAAGVVSHLLAPFGIGDELLGFLTVERLRMRPWTPAEVRAIELIAADVGRALHHARLYEREQALVTELREVDRAKTDFLSAISHELRTPLTGVLGYMELLRAGRSGPLSPAQAVMLGKIDKSTRRLGGLVENLLTVSRIESGGLKTVPRPVDLAGLVVAAADALRPEAEAKGVGLSAEAAPGGLVVDGDAGQLDRALTNLVSNAVKFTPAGGTVLVSSAAAPSGDPASGPASAVVTVRDTGIGIPEAEQPHLFDRFFRGAEAARQAIPGTGIGLAIVRTIVANHRGTIAVRSREGQGTTVTVRLPLT